MPSCVLVSVPRKSLLLLLLPTRASWAVPGCGLALVSDLVVPDFVHSRQNALTMRQHSWAAQLSLDLEQEASGVIKVALGPEVTRHLSPIESAGRGLV